MRESDESEFVDYVAERLREPERVEQAFEARIRSAVRSAAARGEAPWLAPPARATRRRRWYPITAPRTISVSPVMGLAAAAGFAALVAGSTAAVIVARGGSFSPQVASTPSADPARAADREVVRFTIAAPAARSVTLVGDFNGWNPVATPLVKATSDSVWTVTVPLSVGRYQYAFILDGTAWRADPAGRLSLKDEFGTPSSLITVEERRT
jgi:hypothetical protein